MAIKEVEAYKFAQSLKAATTLISKKDGEFNIVQAALVAAEVKALANVATAQVEGRAAADVKVAAIRVEPEEVVATTRAEAEKIVEDEFRAGFFQGYFDLKRRVVVAHLE